MEERAGHECCPRLCWELGGLHRLMPGPPPTHAGTAAQGPDCQLRVRLLLHCAAKLQGPGTDLSQLLEQLDSNVDDQVG